ncbi:MAG: rRNA adenine N-6-methyltransferase family protein, partial [Parachlamydiaceae bacterium]
FKVKRTSFLPAPKVDSAVVKLEIRTPPRVSNEETFFKMVREAFNHRRKMLRGSLSKLYSREALERALPYPEARPENLDLGELIALFEAVKDEIAANENDR